MTEEEAMDDWENTKYDQGFHPTIIFNDPTDDKILFVMTEDNNRSSSYVYRAGFELR